MWTDMSHSQLLSHVFSNINSTIAHQMEGTRPLEHYQVWCRGRRGQLMEYQHHHHPPSTPLVSSSLLLVISNTTIYYHYQCYHYLYRYHFRVVIINLVHLIPFWNHISPKEYPYMCDHVFCFVVLLFVCFVTEEYPIDILNCLDWMNMSWATCKGGVRWRLRHALPCVSPTWWQGDVPHTHSRILRKAALHWKRHPVGENCYAPARSRRII